METDQEEKKGVVAPAGPHSLKCLMCGAELQYRGKRKFHVGDRGLVLGLGNVSKLLVDLEPLRVYVCPQCGRIELFAPPEGQKSSSPAKEN